MNLEKALKARAQEFTMTRDYGKMHDGTIPKSLFWSLIQMAKAEKEERLKQAERERQEAGKGSREY